MRLFEMWHSPRTLIGTVIRTPARGFLVDLKLAAAGAALLLATSGCMQNSQSPQGNGQSMGHSDPAARQFERSEDPPIKAETFFAAGRLAESQNDLPRAILEYERCLKLNPNHKDALYRVGVVQAQLKHFPESIIAWKKYVHATHENPTSYSNLGFGYELAGQLDDAEAAYKKGIAKDPRNVPCRVNYGLMLARTNRIGESIIELQAVLSQAEVHYNLASVFERQGRKETAKLEYKKALEADPNFQDALIRMSALQ